MSECLGGHVVSGSPEIYRSVGRIARMYECLRSHVVSGSPVIEALVGLRE